MGSRQSIIRVEAPVEREALLYGVLFDMQFLFHYTHLTRLKFHGRQASTDKFSVHGMQGMVNALLVILALLQLPQSRVSTALL